MDQTYKLRSGSNMNHSTRASIQWNQEDSINQLRECVKCEPGESRGIECCVSDSSLSDKSSLIAPVTWRSIFAHVPDIFLKLDSYSLNLPSELNCLSVIMCVDLSGFTSLCETYSNTSKTGADQLINTLNSYINLLVSEILAYAGDVLRISDDAILAAWYVDTMETMDSAVLHAAECALAVQNKHGVFMTPEGVELYAKIGISAGEMTVILVGNEEFSYHIELGPAMDEAKHVKDFWQPGDVILSPSAWSHCSGAVIKHKVMEDGRHIKVTEVIERKRILPYYRPTSNQISEDLLGPSAKKSKSDTIVHDNQLMYQPEKWVRKSFYKKFEFSLVDKLKRFISRSLMSNLEEKQPMVHLREARQITSVFVNIKITPVSAQHRRIILTECLPTLYQITYRFNGQVSKVTVCENDLQFLIVFSTKGLNHNTDEALLCAHKLRKDLKVRHDVTVVSVGVTTGSSYCGLVGNTHRVEFMALGVKVNVAARLTMIYPNKVTCDEDSYILSELDDYNFHNVKSNLIQGLPADEIIKEFSPSQGLGQKRKSSTADVVERKRKPLVNRCLLSCVCTVLPRHQGLLPDKREFLRDRVRALDSEFMEGLTSRVVVCNGLGEILLNVYVGPHHGHTRETWCGSQVGPSERWTEYTEVQQRVGDLLQDRITVGHSIESDLEKLEINIPVGNIRDTAQYRPLVSAVYPGSHTTHVSLKAALKFFGYEVQDEDYYHCPTQDTLSTLFLYVHFMDQWEAEVTAQRLAMTPVHSTNTTTTITASTTTAPASTGLPEVWSDEIFWKVVAERERERSDVVNDKDGRINSVEMNQLLSEDDIFILSDSDSLDEND